MDQIVVSVLGLLHLSPTMGVIIGAVAFAASEILGAIPGPQSGVVSSLYVGLKGLLSSIANAFKKS